MKLHWHAGPEDVLLYGLSAILVINAFRIIAGHLVSSTNPTLSTVGSGIGSLVG